MKNAIIAEIENKQKKQGLPEYKTGDYVKIHVKIVEGKKERIQIFEGIIIKHSGSGLNAVVTVRKVVDGIGVERTFPIHSKVVSNIEIVKYSKVRRSRLFYLRELLGSKVMRVKEDLDKNIKAASDKAKDRKERIKKAEVAANLKREEEAIEKQAQEAEAAAKAKSEEKATEEKPQEEAAAEVKPEEKATEEKPQEAKPATAENTPEVK